MVRQDGTETAPRHARQVHASDAPGAGGGFPRAGAKRRDPSPALSGHELATKT
jgi:hypothetical protein